MATPEVADEEAGGVQPAVEQADEALDDGGDVEESEDVAGEEPNIEEVDLSEDDFSGDGDLFTGTEEAQSSDDSGGSESSDDGGEEDGSEDEGDGPLLGSFLDEDRGETMEKRINEGAARLAVVGLGPEHKRGTEEGGEDSLEGEFAGVFEAFGLGHFGVEFVHEYVVSEEEDDIDPAWGLLGSILVASAMVVYLRPDGDELAARAKDSLGNIAGGVA